MGQNISNKYGRNAFTVQEAINTQSYTSYKCELETMDGTDQETVDWSTTEQGPANEILIYGTAGVPDDVFDIYLKIDGVYGDAIRMDGGDMPFNVTGLMIDQVKLNTSSGNNDVIAVLSFH